MGKNLKLNAINFRLMNIQHFFFFSCVCVSAVESNNIQKKKEEEEKYKDNRNSCPT